MDTESLWFAFQRFVEAHGWKLLAAALLLLVVQRRYREHAVNAHAQRALADANGEFVCVDGWMVIISSS